MKPIETLGFVGLGVMGEPMWANLVSKSGRPQESQQSCCIVRAADPSRLVLISRRREIGTRASG